jgi:rhodanese-related sulfurtransferase
MSELMARLPEVPEDREVYVICKVGGRSAQVVGYLNAQGRETVNVSGGMLAWAAAGRPMISPGGADPFVA